MVVAFFHLIESFSITGSSFSNHRFQLLLSLIHLLYWNQVIFCWSRIFFLLEPANDFAVTSFLLLEIICYDQEAATHFCWNHINICWNRDLICFKQITGFARCSS